ncbi:hypothetical protein N3K66_001772 [Trichothecium roseum]|uniref:Uncharacterized protein n=1 Tax=Trichothecium roseum TaxID=47278 RepID=A0ACC0V9L3_9HYPO|nr:hypothetical protein N3K66_001772 [Trichothecium roseum]
MEHPVKEIGNVITTLCKGSPEQQESTLKAYFLPNASFTHPFCRVPSFSKGDVPLAGGVDSLWVILGVYRWYRTMSPHIDIAVDSAVFDQRSGLLYVTLRQTFAVWFIPLYKAPVKLVSVLQLTQRSSSEQPADASSTGRSGGGGSLAEGRESLSSSPGALAGPGQERARFYIASQEDLYQVNDCLQFLLPGLGPMLWFGWQVYSTVLCVIGSLLFLPLYLVLNKGARAKSG